MPNASFDSTKVAWSLGTPVSVIIVRGKEILYFLPRRRTLTCCISTRSLKEFNIMSWISSYAIKQQCSNDNLRTLYEWHCHRVNSLLLCDLVGLPPSQDRHEIPFRIRIIRTLFGIYTIPAMMLSGYLQIAAWHTTVHNMSVVSNVHFNKFNFITVKCYLSSTSYLLINSEFVYSWMKKVKNEEFNGRMQSEITLLRDADALVQWWIHLVESFPLSMFAWFFIFYSLYMLISIRTGEIDISIVTKQK